MKYFILILSVFIQLNINAQTTAIPDANFEQALIDLGLDSGPIDGVVLTANISSIDSLNVGLKNINFMTGIEDFTNLKYLNCLNNQIYTLDVTQNLNLKYLICSLNNISVLDVTQNVLLIDLFCDGNQLTSLNVSQNTALKKLLCGGNAITSLNVSQNTALEHLECFNNQINNLDISQNTMLTYFACNNNLLTSLNVQNGNNTNFTLFGATNNPNLSCIQVDNVAYSTINWTNVDATASYSTNCSVGVNEEKNVLKASIYPNPTKDFITVEVETQSNAKIQLEIIDVTGKKVLQQLISESSRHVVDVSMLGKGYYTLFLKNNSEIVSTQKLIINP